MTRIFIEDDYESFADFHDKEWLLAQFQLTKSTPIEIQLSSFAASWWGHARSFCLPWLFIGSIHDLVEGELLVRNSTKQEFWDRYLEIDGFKAALWKLAENSYCGLYYAYELLLVEIINMSLDERTRVTDRKFNSQVINHFGATLGNRLWNETSISTAREVRNCLVHNGGKATDKLLNRQSLPMIDDGQIMISASDTRALYSALQSRVEQLIKFEISRYSS